MTAQGVTLRFEHGTLRGPPTLAIEDSLDDAGLSLPCPRERATELATVRSWLTRHPPRLTGGEGPWPCEPVDGGAAIAGILRRTADADAGPNDDRASHGPPRSGRRRTPR